MKTIRIVIIEDDAILRKGYATILGKVEDYSIVNTYSSFDDARKSLESDDPDVILLDIELPGLNGIDAIPIIKKAIPKTHIIMLTVYEFEDQIFNALSNGASGYLVKNTPMPKIIDSIREVRDGGGPMSAHIARMVIKSFQKNDLSPLSKRETQILEMIRDVKNRKQIADELFIDPETVKSHLKNIYAKLHVNSKSEAIEAARKNRLI
ncbi:MAG: response regulator transcription factor [Bacteroidota bacterium]